MTPCYSSFIVGVFTIALVVYDIIEKDWENTWKHALGGTVLTGLFWLLCVFLGNMITLGILVIPTLFFLVFALGILMTGESLKRQGCCVKCNGEESTCKGQINSIQPEISVKISSCEFNPQLKAIPLL